MTLGSFSGHFWDVLGAKLGGASAFLELLRVAKWQGGRLQSDNKATPKARKKKTAFFLGFQMGR